MKIWEMSFEVDKYNFFDGDKIKIEKNIHFKGKSLIDVWENIDVDTYYKKKKIPDGIRFTYGAALFNDKALEKLSLYLDGKVEILPFYHEGIKYHVINVLNVIDAVDYDKSVFDRRVDGEIASFSKYVLREEVVKNQHIFKVPVQNTLMIHVSDEFKKCVEDSKLKGFIFEELWDSEASDSIVNSEVHNEDSIQLNSINTEASQHTKVEEVYPEISVEDAKVLQGQIIDKLVDKIIKYVKGVPKEQGDISMLGISYYFNGRYTDIGLKVDVFIDNKEEDDYYYDEKFFQLLDSKDIEFDFYTLQNHYVKDFMNDDETDRFDDIIEDISIKLTEKIRRIQWKDICKITNDFEIEDPESYD